MNLDISFLTFLIYIFIHNPSSHICAVKWKLFFGFFFGVWWYLGSFWAKNIKKNDRGVFSDDRIAFWADFRKIEIWKRFFFLIWERFFFPPDIYFSTITTYTMKYILYVKIHFLGQLFTPFWIFVISQFGSGDFRWNSGLSSV